MRADRLERRRAEYDAQAAYIAKTEEFIRRYGAGQRAREAKGRAKRLARLERLQRPEAFQRLRVDLSTQRRSGDVALSTRGAAIGYPGRTALHLPGTGHPPRRARGPDRPQRLRQDDSAAHRPRRGAARSRGNSGWAPTFAPATTPRPTRASIPRSASWTPSCRCCRTSSGPAASWPATCSPAMTSSSASATCRAASAAAWPWPCFR